MVFDTDRSPVITGMRIEQRDRALYYSPIGNEAVLIVSETISLERAAKYGVPCLAEPLGAQVSSMLDGRLKLRVDVEVEVSLVLRPVSVDEAMTTSGSPTTLDRLSALGDQVGPPGGMLERRKGDAFATISHVRNMRQAAGEVLQEFGARFSNEMEGR